VIVDHNHTDITQIPQSAIEQAKARLHIAYGHTSHGSQLTTGMTDLVAFANNGSLDDEYLTPMSQLEIEYPQVKFVYMTGNVDIWDDTDNKAANKMIRDFCTASDKLLYRSGQRGCADIQCRHFIGRNWQGKPFGLPHGQ
jgi:hypothetical protein